MKALGAAYWIFWCGYHSRRCASQQNRSSLHETGVAQHCRRRCLSARTFVVTLTNEGRAAVRIVIHHRKLDVDVAGEKGQVSRPLSRGYPRAANFF